MRKLLKKFVTGFVCLFLLSTTVFAAEEILPVSSSFIYGIFSDIIAESDGQLLITFHLNSPAPMTELGTSSIEIYENNGRTTKLVDTIYATDRGYEHMLGSGTYHASNITYDGTIGYQYYVKVHFTASNSNGGDTATSTSRAVTAIK